MADASIYKWEPNQLSFRTGRLLLGGLIRLYFRPDVYGAHHVPRSGGMVLACNHQSNLDPLLMGMFAPRLPSPLAKIELFSIPVVKTIIASWGAMPVKRGSIDPEALKLADKVLEAGETLMLFPEGTRSKDGNLLKFRPGAARLAIKHHVPIVPAAVWGAHRAFSKGSKLPRPTKVRVLFGPPIPTAHYEYDREKQTLPPVKMVDEVNQLLRAALERQLEVLRRLDEQG